jgi:hypothetical protein
MSPGAVSNSLSLSLSLSEDTDSAIFCCHFPELSQNLLEDTPEFRARLAACFEDKESEIHQTSLLKAEGIWSAGLFR